MNTLNLLLSIIALVIGIIAFFSKGCSCVSEIALSLIAICTTLIVGLAVVDTLRMHQMEKRINDLEESAEHLKEFKRELSAAFETSIGISLLNWQPYTAFGYFQKGLEKSLSMDNIKWIGQCLQCMENVPKMIRKMKEKGMETNEKMKGKIPAKTPDSIKKYEAYKAFQKRIDEIYKKMNELQENNHETI